MARILHTLPAAVAALVVCGAASAAAQTPADSLFLQQAAGGKLTGSKLTLRGVSPRVTTFTDRPAREGGSLSLRSFVAGWEASFGDDPPNAALEVTNAPKGRDVALVELRAPRYDARRRTLTYSVRPLEPADRGSLAPFGRRADGSSSVTRFGRATLFIDPSAGESSLAIIQATAPSSAAVTFSLGNSVFDYDAAGVIVAGISTPFVYTSNNIPQFAPGELQLKSTQITFTDSGGGGGLTASVITSIDVPASGVLTGTASVPGGASLTFTPVGGATTPIPNGAFSVPFSDS